jgi:hypothetical protein
MFVKQVDLVTVIDPDTDAPVDVTIYKDPLSGAMIGVDASWVATEQSVTLGERDGAFYSPFNKDYVLIPEE